MGLDREPANFGEAAEEFRLTPLEEIARRIDDHSTGSFILGAFADTRLIGITGFARANRLRRNHTGTVWGVFIHPEYRGRGIAGLLLRSLIESASQQPGLIQISLTVASDNTSAKRLYAAAGFRKIGAEPRGVKVNDTYIDQDFMLLDIR